LFVAFWLNLVDFGRWSSIAAGVYSDFLAGRVS
jgi:hypothetical protein